MGVGGGSERDEERKDDGPGNVRQRIEGTLRDKYGKNDIVLRLSFERYDREVRSPTQDIFVRFDDHYEQFTAFLLEQVDVRSVQDSLPGHPKLDAIPPDLARSIGRHPSLPHPTRTSPKGRTRSTQH